MHSAGKRGRTKVVNFMLSRRDEGEDGILELTAGLKVDTVDSDRSRGVQIPLLVCSKPVADKLLEFVELRLGGSPSDVHSKSFRHVSGSSNVSDLESRENGVGVEGFGSIQTSEESREDPHLLDDEVLSAYEDSVTCVERVGDEDEDLGRGEERERVSRVLHRRGEKRSGAHD